MYKVEAAIRFSEEEHVKAQAFSLGQRESPGLGGEHVLKFVIRSTDVIDVYGSLDRGWSLSLNPNFNGIWWLFKRNPEALVTGLLLCLSNPLQDCKALVSGH